MHNDAPTAILATLALYELSVFQSTATDAQFAPHVRDTVELSRVSGYALNHFEALMERIGQLGGDALALMEERAPSLTAFNERTQPKDWHESLMKSYVHDGLLRDYAKSSLLALDADSKNVITAVLDDTRREELLRARLGELINDQDILGSRLALWGRKLVVETAKRLTEIVELTTDHEHLDAKAWQSALTGHSRRMSAIGLVA